MFRLVNTGVSRCKRFPCWVSKCPSERSGVSSSRVLLSFIFSGGQLSSAYLLASRAISTLLRSDFDQSQSRINIIAQHLPIFNSCIEISASISIRLHQY